MHRQLLLTGALALCACGRPTEVAVQFHDALAQGNGTKAFALLSTPTQAKLKKIAATAHDSSAGLISADPAQMIAHGDPSIYPVPTPNQPKVVRAALISMEGGRAKVAVHIGEATSEMDLVREDWRWKIDLPVGSP